MTPDQVDAHQRRVKAARPTWHDYQFMVDGPIRTPTDQDLGRKGKAGARIGNQNAKPSKYRNKITVVDGIKFHSKAEARRWGELKLLEQAGQISHLRRQVRFSRIRPDGEIIEIYICDFDYRDAGLTGMRNGNKRHVEDVKSEATAATPAYVRKKKWMHSEYGIAIEEIKA